MSSRAKEDVANGRSFLPSRGINAFAVAVLVSVLPTEAMAQAATLGDIVCNLFENSKAFAPLFSALAYVCGAMFAISAVLLFKKHADNPNDSQVVKGLAHSLAAGALAAFPSAVSVFAETIHVSGGAAGAGCSATAPVTGSLSLDVMMQNFVKNIHQPMFAILSALCYLMGAFLIYKGLVRAAKIGTDPRAAATHVVLTNLIVGAVLVSIGGMLPSMLETLFGVGTINKSSDFDSIINWSKIVGPGVDTSKADLTIKGILMFVQIVGAIAFVRGWLIIKTAVEGSGQATVPQGLTHVLGGAMAINIGTILKIFDTTFGAGIVK